MADTAMNVDSSDHSAYLPSATSNMTTITDEIQSEKASIVTGVPSAAAQPHSSTNETIAPNTTATAQPSLVVDDVTTFIKSEPVSPEPTSVSIISQSASLHTPIHTDTTVPDGAPVVAFTNQNTITSASLEFSYLRKIIAEASPAELEKSIKIATTALSNLKSHLLTVTNNSNAARCLKLVEEAKASYRTARTVIGVIGETGAGKSSLINALLGTEKIVPTNCMRACTAVSTEISWNESARPEEKFRAEIEFITPDEWLAELVHLFKDVTDGSGEIVINTNKETDAGVAWAKIKSIYPSIDERILSKTSAKSLSRHTSTQAILGTTKKLNATSANALYKLVQQYIDSKDNSSDCKSSGPSVLWPLIKVVRIYLKSEVLSTGAVLVDLPGVGDSNAARASVADRYLEKCDGIWIVAPIIRAVDNKTAQHLLGEAFKMQLKFDGSFSNISFVCSRTDEIAVDEAVESLGLNKEHEVALAVEKRHGKETQAIIAKIESLVATVNEEAMSKAQIEKQITIWYKLSSRHAKGQNVFAPSKETRKRKHTARHTRLTKRRQSQRVSVIDSDEEEELTEEVSNGEPLTAAKIDAMLAQLEDKQKSLDRSIQANEDKIEELEDRTEDLNEELERSKHNILSLCIASRNEFSRKEIQDHYACGIEKLDQETAMKDDADSFNPDHKIRDYEEVARALPVFCVSSRAYQSQMGRIKSDNKFEGLTVNQTEIPQLLEHAHHITESRRIANCTKYLNCGLLVFQSLKTWLEANDTGIKITGEEVEAETEKMKKDLLDLRKMLDEAANRSISHFRTILEKQLFRPIAVAAKKASVGVFPIVESWGRPVNEGGYFHSTYKAVCVRDGTYSRKNIDFNQDLIKPFKQQLATAWESTFSDAIPKMLDEFHQETEQAMEAFQGKLKSRIQHEGLARRINDLHPQLKAYTQAMKDSQADFGRNIHEWQREASRVLTPGVKEAMKSAYYNCAAESGTGSFVRMKAIMLEHANDLKRRQNVFTKSTQEVKKRLNRMFSDYREALPERITTTIDNITSDYLEAIQKVEDVDAPEDTRRAIIDILSRLNSDLNLTRTA